MNEIIKFIDGDFELELFSGNEENIVWVSINEMAELFERDRSVISRHINSIFNDDMLDEKSNVQKMHVANSDKPVKFYSLETTLQVGYRVKSKRGALFRKWATGILKQYLTEGIVYNEKILEAHQKVLSMIPLIERNTDTIDSIDVLDVVKNYAKALNLLDDYDHQRVRKPKGNKKEAYILNYSELRKFIDLMSLNETSGLFGREKDASFKSSISSIYSTFDGSDLYKTVEEKAANLLYFITKNHSFIDGNKRIAAATFLYFLDKNNILYTRTNLKVMTDETLVAVTIMIATSRPEEKNIIIDLVMNLIK